MKMRSAASWMLAAWFALQLGLSIGCESSEAQKSEAQKIAALKKTLVADKEPESPKSIAEAKEKVSETANVVVRGIIKARDFDPFEKDKSVFTITDIVDDGHEGDPTHNADDCPFCKHRAANAAMALVKLVDETGNPHPFSAADLLQVKAGTVVVVEGTATFDPAVDLLSIKAKQVFIAQK
jgi:hypothetical protein